MLMREGGAARLIETVRQFDRMPRPQRRPAAGKPDEEGFGPGIFGGQGKPRARQNMTPLAGSGRVQQA
jgi:hypothetical protein